MNPETKQFISANLTADTHQLAFLSTRFPGVDMPLGIRQINGKQKIKTKVPLFYNNDEILYSAQLSLEQCSSESTAKYKSLLCEGFSFVDLTGGFGIDCYFISKRFEQTTYVERNSDLCELAKHNFKVLNQQNINVVNANSEEYLIRMEPVDWIFIDPARRSSSGKKVVLLSDCDPDVSRLLPFLLEKAPHIMIKLSPMIDISAAVKDLPYTSEIQIISVENECKEVLLLIDHETHENQRITAVNIGKNEKNEIFEFYANDESKTTISFATEIKQYLYEPNSSVMKSGAFKMISKRFGLDKLHKNTHLYTSTELSSDFPGRIFEVQKKWGCSKKELKQLAENNPKANISTRNFPASVDELRKKLKIKEGGNIYLFACTLSDESKSIIECKKVQ